MKVVSNVASSLQIRSRLSISVEISSPPSGHRQSNYRDLNSHTISSLIFTRNDFPFQLYIINTHIMAAIGRQMNVGMFRCTAVLALAPFEITNDSFLKTQVHLE